VWNQNLKLGKSAFFKEYFMGKCQTNLRWCGGWHWSSWHGM